MAAEVEREQAEQRVQTPLAYELQEHAADRLAREKDEALRREIEGIYLGTCLAIESGRDLTQADADEALVFLASDIR